MRATVIPPSGYFAITSELKSKTLIFRLSMNLRKLMHIGKQYLVKLLKD